MSVNNLFEANLVCPICYEYFIYPTSVHPCCHTFCEDCIYRWRKSQDEDPEKIMLRNTCPVCRTTIVGQARSTAFENMIEACIEKWGDDCFTSKEKRLARDELKIVRKQGLLQRKNEELAQQSGQQQNQSRYSTRNIYDLIFDSSGEFFGVLRPHQTPASEENDRQVPSSTDERPSENNNILTEDLNISPLSQNNTPYEWGTSTTTIPDSTTQRQLSESGDIFYNVTRVSNIFNNNTNNGPLSSTQELNVQETDHEADFQDVDDEGIVVDRVVNDNESLRSNLVEASHDFERHSDFIQRMIRDFDEESIESLQEPESRYAEEWPFGHLNDSLWNRNEERIQPEPFNDGSFQISNPHVLSSSFSSLEEEEIELPVPEQIRLPNNLISEQDPDAFPENNQFLDDANWLDESTEESDYRSPARSDTNNSLGQEVLAWIARQRQENTTQSSFEDSNFDPDLIRNEIQNTRSTNDQHESTFELINNELINKTYDQDTVSVNTSHRSESIGSENTSPISDYYRADNHNDINDPGTSGYSNPVGRILDSNTSNSDDYNWPESNFLSGVAPSYRSWSTTRHPTNYLEDDWSDLEEASEDEWSVRIIDGR